MSRDLVSIDLIKFELNARLDSLVMQLYPAARKDGPEWRLGDLSGRPGQSLAIHRMGNRAGWWKDFSSGEGGDVIGLIQHGACGGDIKRAIAWAKDWLGMGNGSIDPVDRKRREKEADRIKAAQAEEERQAREKRRRAAMRYYLEALPLPGTPGERYLIGRHIDLRRLGKAPGALRYHPEMLDRANGVYRPCLIGKLDGPDGQLVTIHRTFLHIHSDGRVTKASEDPDCPMRDEKGQCAAKLAFGAYAGAWIPIWRGVSGKPMRKMADGEWITITEGIEDALTLAIAQPQLRIVSALSLSNLGNLLLPERAGGLIVAADNDAGEDARRGLERAIARLETRGFRVRTVRPPARFKDFNDWGKALAKAAPPVTMGGAA